MKVLQSVTMALPLAAMMLFAQSQTTQDPNRSGQSTSSQTDRSAQPGQSGQPAAPSSPSADRTSSGSSMTFNGTVVNAECPQSQALIDRASSAGSFADRAASSSAGASSTTPAAAKNPKSVYDLQRDVMRRCAASEKSTNLALLTDDGRFLKLDGAGATQVKTEGGKAIKNMKVTINGSLSGDTLTVQSVSKAAPKPGA